MTTESFIGSSEEENSAPDTSKDTEIQVVKFKLGEEIFALDIKYIQEIIKPQTMTRVPNSKPFIDGVINMRGSISVIVDLRTKLGFEKKEYDDDTRIIMIELNEEIMGLRVDSVSETVRFSESEVQDPPALVTKKIGQDLLQGIYNLQDQNQLLLILNIENIFPQGEGQ